MNISHLRSRALTLLDVAMIVAALTFIFLSTHRTPAFSITVRALLWVLIGLDLCKSWKAGWLTKSPRQIFEAMRASGAPARRRFERFAITLGVIAMAVVAWG